MIALQTDRQSELKSSFSTHNTVFVYIVLFLEEGKIAVITLNNPGIQYFFQYGLETNYFWPYIYMWCPNPAELSSTEYSLT